MIDKNRFGYTIRCIRKFRNHSQKELAAMAGISVSTLARYEKNETTIPGDVFIRLVILLRISSDMVIYSPDRSAPNLFTGGRTIPDSESDALKEKAFSSL